ncbi:DNA/RNA non-specific endonuclease [Pseudomonas capsici]|uniref:DNA/RNA non-specific endonuclease n=1 Tax=Pseudomonas capsici TaxID=2810614 RepID=UPI0021F1690D|nr:DNA/RNA non-specific endonuclease [Pseudomonas capsici]MCV4344077.1 DNA/RNA non-specific endonuclease [Pseudomonas capsici]
MEVDENTWVDVLKDGKFVSVKVEPVYSGSSIRPDRFNVKYLIGGGRPVNVDFKNAPGGGGWMNSCFMKKLGSF